MQLRIRQRIFSWTDSYDVYDEDGDPRFEVRTDLLAFGHQIHVYNKRTGREVGSIHEKLFRLLPRFDVVIGGRKMGYVRKELSLFVPRFYVNYLNWKVEGDLVGWDYRVRTGLRQVMAISKDIFTLSDTYIMEFSDPMDELPGLLLVLAIDAANCSSQK